MTEEARTLLRRLKNGHSGKARAVTADQLGKELGMNDRKVRLIIRDIRLEFITIASTPDESIYWPETEEECEHTSLYLWSLNNRVREAAVAHDKAVKKRFHNKDYGELTLFKGAL